MSETKNIRLTKKGLPDKRSETSKKNLEKGKSVIKVALEKLKEQPKEEVKYSSDEYSTDEEEEELIKIKEIKLDEGIKEVKEEPVSKEQIQPIEEPIKPIADDYKFTFEKKLEEITNKYNSLENETKLTKEELQTIKAQNQELKKTMTKTFRSHAGILNQEMFLKF